MKYITATFLFLIFNASWQWWALMCAWMLTEAIFLIIKFRQEYKNQIKSLNLGEETKVLTKTQLEEIWNNGYQVGTEHAQMKKH